MTWKELQPCLLPLTGPQRPAQTQTGKAKRKLQPPPNHIRVERKAAAKAMPSSSPVGPVDANGGTPGREQHGDEEEAELANEQSREDVGPPTRVTTGDI